MYGTLTTKQETNSPKWAKVQNAHDGKKYVVRHSTPLVTRKVQRETVRSPHAPREWLSLNDGRSPASGRTRRSGSAHSLLAGAQNGLATLENSWAASCKVSHTHDPEIASRGIYPRERNTCVHETTQTKMPLAALRGHTGLKPSAHHPVNGQPHGVPLLGGERSRPLAGTQGGPQRTVGPEGPDTEALGDCVECTAEKPRLPGQGAEGRRPGGRRPGRGRPHGPRRASPGREAPHLATAVVGPSHVRFSETLFYTPERGASRCNTHTNPIKLMKKQKRKRKNIGVETRQQSPRKASSGPLPDAAEPGPDSWGRGGAPAVNRWPPLPLGSGTHC